MGQIQRFSIICIAMLNGIALLEAFPTTSLLAQFPKDSDSDNANNLAATRIELEAKAMEMLLEKSSKMGSSLSQSNDLSQINLDYENSNSEDESERSSRNIDIDNPSPARARRTIGTLYCSIFFTSNPSECPLRRGRVRSILFPSSRQAQQAQVNPQQLFNTENEFWLNRLQNNDLGLAGNSSNMIASPIRPIKERRPFGSSLRLVFPRLYNAFNQGYRTGSGTGANNNYESNSVDSNQSTRFPFLRALNPFRYMRNFLARRTDSAQYK